jgi:para-aminobenzoate synthetase component I
MIIKRIETTLTSADIFALFKDRKHCFFLDSGMDPEKLGRYSFIGFEPEITFESKDGMVTVEGAGRDTTGPANPFDALKALLKSYEAVYSTELPFIGGAVGYFGYDMCHHIEKLPRTAVDDTGIPDCFFGIYDFVIAVDHVAQKVFAASPEIFGDAKAG